MTSQERTAWHDEIVHYYQYYRLLLSHRASVKETKRRFDIDTETLRTLCRQAGVWEPKRR